MWVRWFLGAALLLPAAALAQSSAGGGGGGSASSVSVSNFPSTQAVSLSSLPAFAQTPTFNLGTLNGAATDASVVAVKNALGSPLQAGGSVSVSNLPATQAVSGTFWQATQPVSIPSLPPLAAGSNVIGSTVLRSAGTNRSASVTTTASTLMAANTSRQGWKIKNDCAVAVWISFDGTATAAAGSGNMQVPAGGYLSSEPGFTETGAMSSIAASGSCALTAREY